MHRSGTSLIARIINLLGISLGPKERMMKPLLENPKGFWEHTALTALNQEILAKLGGTWHEPPTFPPGWEQSPELAELRRRARSLIANDFATVQSWGWKDPRNSLTLPFWRSLLPPLRHVICLRNPIDVAHSVAARNHFSIEKGTRLWLLHLRAALEHTAGQPRLLVFYEDMMTNWSRELRQLAAFLDRPEIADQADVQAVVQEFVDQDLRHHRTSLIDAVDDPELSFPAKALYLFLRAYIQLPQGEVDGHEDRAERAQDALQLFSAYSLDAHTDFERLRDLLTQRTEELTRNEQGRRQLESELQAEKDRSARQLSERDGSLAATKVAIDERDKQLADKESAIQGLHVQLSIREKNLQAIQAQARVELDRLAEQVAQNEQALLNRAEQEQALRAGYAQLQVERQQATDLLAQREQNIKALQGRVDQLTAQLQSAHASAAEAAEKELVLRSSHDAVQVRLSAQTAEMGQAVQRLQALEALLQAEHARRAQEEQTARELRAIIAERESALGDLRSRYEAERKQWADELQDAVRPESAACTIVAKSQLAQARVLANSFRAHHPDIPFFVLLADRGDGYVKPGADEFHLTQLDELDIPAHNELQFKCSMSELMARVKPYFLQHLFKRHELKKLVYLDADVLILDNLAPLFATLDERSIVLAPYLASSQEEEGVWTSDLRVLHESAHSTGFIALADKPTTHEFLAWWHKSIEQGTPAPGADQRWIDRVPALFGDVHVVREPGYNLGYWNLHCRRIEFVNGKTLANGQPAYFFSFSGFEPDNPKGVSRHQNRYTLEMLGEAQKLFQNYRDLLLAQGYNTSIRWPYAYDAFDNGVTVPEIARRMYRRLGREARRFGNPFQSNLPGGFFDWLNSSVDGEQDDARGITRLWHELYSLRPDVQQAFPDLFGADREPFLQWVERHGIEESGLDERFLGNGAVARRQMIQVKPKSPPQATAGERKAFGVNIAGYIASEKGVGEGVRSDIRMMQAAEIPFVLNNFADPGSSNQDLTFEHFSFGNPFPVNLIHINADATPEFARRKGKAYFADHYNIGYWAWELSEFPREWYPSFQFLDEIWVPSNFTLESISRIAPVPVVRVPHCLTEDLPRAELGRSHFGLPHDKFIFLFIFDFHSYMGRKNPLAVVQAFKQAFRAGDNAVLVFKCSRPDFNPPGFRAIKELAEGLPFLIIDEVLSREEINTLIGLADCYVSLHRSEGFGLTLAEAMSLEKPVIATGYSGNIDFMTPANSLLVKYKLVELDQDHGPYKKGNVWADPDIQHTAELMRFVYEKPDQAREIGRRARQDVLRHLSPQAVGELVKQRFLAVSKLGRITYPANAPEGRPAKPPAPHTYQAPKAVDYRQLVARVREVVGKTIPDAATVLVVSRGDNELLNFDRRRGWHFPRTNDGTYAGYYPANSEGAIAQLEAARSLGAHYLLFPTTALWWLDYYAGLRAHLEQHYKLVCRHDACWIYELGAATISAPAVAAAQAEIAGPCTSLAPPQCSIIIPVFNKAALTRQCLDRLLAAPESISTEIIVVDDGSTDSTPELLAGHGRRIHALRHESNSGFAKACNHGAGAATGEYLIFLNNDTIPKPGWLDALVNYARSHPKAGVVGSKLLFPNDTVQHAGVVICQDRLPRHIYTGFPADHPAVNKSRAYTAVTGACMLIRKKLFEEVGGFDTTFVNSCEDIDLCLRLRQRGYEAHYCKDSVLYHLESVSRQGRSKEEQQNNQIYRGRWAEHTTPDDLRYYLEDGLLRVNYTPLHPLPFEISPLLGVVKGVEGPDSAEQLLASRSQQVLDLLKENIRLNVQVQEAQMHQGVSTNGAPTPANAMPEAQRIAIEPAQESTALQPVDRVTGRTSHVKAALVSSNIGQDTLLEAHQQLLAEDAEIQTAKCALQATMTAVRQQKASQTPLEAGTGKYIRYQQLIQHLRELVHTSLPLDAKIIVVSRGDPELLKLGCGRTWHFPQAVDGTYAGHYPADSAAAIAHLEEVRARGGEYLLLPSPAFWWLDYYGDFKAHLDMNYRRCWNDQACIIYKLTEADRSSTPIWRRPVSAFRSFVTSFRHPRTPNGRE
jgi:GT2 family glycosyltransferase/glycosyltransferase involved in cell wall biosynthesis